MSHSDIGSHTSLSLISSNIQDSVLRAFSEGIYIHKPNLCERRRCGIYLAICTVM